MILGRFMWWAPWHVTEPWKPRYFHGGDEWHNPSHAVVLPFLGCFIWFYGKGFNRDGEAHLYYIRRTRSGHIAESEGVIHPHCPECREFLYGKNL